jgi:hypothetical protein
VAAGPGDQRAAGTTARGHLRAGDADREQVIDTLKDAFARGRLTRDELGTRTTRVLTSRTYAELAAVTADIPVLVTQAPPRGQPARAPARRPISRKAVAWAAAMIIAPPALWAVFLTYYGGFIVLFLATFASLVIISTLGTSGQMTRPIAGARLQRAVARRDGRAPRPERRSARLGSSRISV